MIQKYGLDFPDGTTAASIELFCFGKAWAREQSGLTRYEHFRNAVDLLWNAPRRAYAAERRLEYDPRKNDAYIWNEWTEAMQEEFCRDIVVGPDGEPLWATAVWGPNASWKTSSAAVFANCEWFASLHDTIIVITSTSLPGLRKRIWKEILRYYRAANPGVGHVNASEFAIRFQKGSDEAGIFGVATGQEEGDIQKAVDKIIGFHARRVIAIVDEGQATNGAIVKACSSLEAGAESFQLIMLGNPDSELDSLGQMSEPVNGYDSIDQNTGRWETKRGVCIHLNGLESPRVKEGDEFYPGLLCQRDIDSTRKAYGEDSPEFWRTRVGFLAPQGVTKSVLSMTMIRKFRAQEKAVWVSGYKMGAGLDPAFEGGDRCILRFGKCGELSEPGGISIGKLGIELGERLVIKVSATSDEPIHYQIVRQVKDECEKRGVPPEMFALDATGEGGGLASIFQREWSAAITLVEFGGRASEMPVSEHIQKPAREAYYNRVTELWYSFRLLVINGQVRGLDNDTALEFCQRVHGLTGNLTQIETKKDMKARTKRSPDLADATVVLTELFRQKENLTRNDGADGTETRDRAWRDYVKRTSTYDENAYLVEA